MALPAEFSLLHSDFNGFLFASIGDETNGNPLSVMSALTRLGVDPWREAARLSDLPRDYAAAELGGSINRLPVGRWQRSDTQSIAARLIRLLPRHSAFAETKRAEPGETKRARLPDTTWVTVLALVAAVFFAMAMSGDLPWRGGHATRSMPSTQSSE